MIGVHCSAWAALQVSDLNLAKLLPQQVTTPVQMLTGSFQNNTFNFNFVTNVM